MLSDALYYWFDGGMRQRTPRGSHVFHVQSNCYRTDFDVFRGTFQGFELCAPPCSREEMTLHAPAASLPLDVILTVETRHASYTTGNLLDAATQAYVLDSGPLVHRVKVDALQFVTDTGIVAEGMHGHIELLFWSDRIYVIYAITPTTDEQLTGIRLAFQHPHADGITLMPSCDDAEAFAWAYLQQSEKLLGMMASENGTIREASLNGAGTLTLEFDLEAIRDGEKYLPAFQFFVAEGDALVDGEQGYREELERRNAPLAFDVETLAGETTCYEGYDAKRGMHLLTMANSDEPFRYRSCPDELERYAYWLKDSRPAHGKRVRLIWQRVGQVGNGELAMEGIWRPWGSHVVHRDEHGRPTGQRLQISKDFHEFNNFPKPYSHCWLHVYCEQSGEALQGKNEIAIAYSTFYGKLAAQFAQLSLLGWDDNPQCQPDDTEILGQLWHQGINGEAEVFCISPESIHTDNFYTDWRSLRSGKKSLNRWASNFGGGDTLRYARAGADHRLRLVAPRIDYVSNGPLLAQMRYAHLSEDEVFRATIAHAILAADDYVRVLLDLTYEVMQDATVYDVSLLSFGAENYNPTVMNTLAVGMGEEVLHLQAVTQDAQEVIQLQQQPTAGSWYAQCSRESRQSAPPEEDGARGIIFRRVELRVQDHPDLHLRPIVNKHPTSFSTTPAITSLIDFQVSEQKVSLRQGDVFHVVAEIIVYPTAPESYDGENPRFASLLEQCYPEELTYMPVLQEAYHNDITVKMITGCSDGKTLPTMTVDEQGVVEFEVVGGIGVLPVTVRSKTYRGEVRLYQQIDGAWSPMPLMHTTGGAYQVDYDSANNVYLIVVGIESAPTSLTRLRRIFRIENC